MFRPALSSYLFRDKFFGRSLGEHDFISALWEFFHDGAELVIPAIEATLSKVTQLAETIRSDTCAKQYRFWSSSLLLIYEGDPRVLPECAQCGNLATLDEPDDAVPGTGDSEARDSDSDTERERLFRDSVSKVTPGDSPAVSPDTQSTAAAGHVPQLDLGDTCSCQAPASGGPRRVDVRLIDFAHTTKVEENAADEGMLFGFECLTRCLSSLLDFAAKPHALREAEEVRMVSDLERAACLGVKKESDALLKKKQS
jgi:hypothetical protein